MAGGVKATHSLIGLISLCTLVVVMITAACGERERSAGPTSDVGSSASQAATATPGSDGAIRRLPDDTGPTTSAAAPGPDHPHAPGTPLAHSHGEPETAGDALQPQLEEQLAQEGPSGHEADGGLLLGSVSGQETVYSGSRCAPGAPVREYDVVAINVEITLNRYLDYDPEGRMYVLEEELARVREEETQNRGARVANTEPAVSLGLQGDAIQPLILRVNQGECLRIALRNGMDNGEPVSLHVHGSSFYMADTGAPAIASNPDSIALPGESATYEWMVEDDESEGTRYFHSHGDDRVQTSHGLFGAVITEPKGSRYVDPVSGRDLRSGWAAVIQDPNGSDFREFAIVYHEIGNESYRQLNRDGEPVVDVDPFTRAYRPGSRAINYRSEPFMNRLQLQLETTGRVDMSQAYSSYVFGDPATPVARSYVGDPVKQRLIHGGSEVFHVHHVHGGAIRWRRQPDAEPTAFDSGLDKTPSLLPKASERVDSQSVGPSETYDIENECGSGGCQQSVGDFLVHCHVAQHYIAGMWMIWRVYNTAQDGSISQDSLPSLVQLPDRKGRTKPAVTSRELAGTTVSWNGKTFNIVPSELATWVERQLPPPGVPIGYDASVLDWRREGDLYLNQPDSRQVWPGFRSALPGIRPPLSFDPSTGKLAYPFLTPHLGQRPPFAPNHGPAPFLDPIANGTDPPRPGENGPGSLCPTGTRSTEFDIHAITLRIVHNSKEAPGLGQVVDERGQLFVLKEEEDDIRANDDLKFPLAIRANAGEDCVDVVFKSELLDGHDPLRFSKVNIHIHFVQFDIQASDGVTTGFNYEQSIRPFAVEGETLEADASRGDSAVRLGSVERFQPGVLVGVGMDQDETFEIRRVASVGEDVLFFDQPLSYSHARGEIVSTEFVRYRWYPDVQFGTAYFHDHVNALTSWRHGLFGALISEPPGSTYRHPHTGAEIRSGPLADIRTDAPVSADISGSFREMVMFIQDEHPTLNVTKASGSAFNLRVEPLPLRGGEPSRLFSSAVHGDPATPILEAFVGDPIVVRALVSATNDVHTWHVDGHWFRVEPFSLTSPPVNTVHLGISERYDLMIPRAGGPQRLPGDYLYLNGRIPRLKEGSWGIIRVYDGLADTALQRLPGREGILPSAASVCPDGAPLKEFNVAAIETPLPMLTGSVGKIYVLQEHKRATKSGARAPEPLVLHVNVGDCIKINLANETTRGPVSFHADMLAFDPRDSYGVEAGFNPPQSVAVGEARTYTYYAHPEIGETAALVTDWGSILENPGLGLYGAIIVGPKGATYTDPVTGGDMSLTSGWRVDVQPPFGASYRDFALFIQDEDEIIGTRIMPYNEQVEGTVGLNYRAGPPLSQRSDDAFASGSEETPLLEAFAGDPVKIHVLVPFSAQSHVFTIEGHQWPFEPGRAGTDLLSSIQVGGMEALTIELSRGAGGRWRLPGDYLYGDHREPYREAGLWGWFRVYPPGASDIELMPLRDR